MEILQKIGLFLVGGGGYVALEFLWRGRSHYTMFLAGGVCFLLLGGLKTRFPRLQPAWGCLLGAGVITAVELATGLMANRDFGIWDYRQLPGNFLGQICLCYSLLWIPLSLGAMELYRLLEWLTRPPQPPAGPGRWAKGSRRRP